MASKLNMSQQNYSKIESGNTKPTETTMQKIAETLETDVETIKMFDEKIVFNITNSKAEQIGSGNTINYQIDARLEKLYSDKIQLLEFENVRLKSELEKYKTL